MTDEIPTGSLGDRESRDRSDALPFGDADDAVDDGADEQTTDERATSDGSIENSGANDTRGTERGDGSGSESGEDAGGVYGVGGADDADEVEPVEVLVQLAEDGEIDPWDIDIVAVTDAFLAELEETDLRTSGRALFYASVLLRMKSDAMVTDEADDEEEEAWETFRAGGEPVGADDPDFDPVDALEAEMDRRLERRSARGTPETLDELVRELREAERGSWWKDSREYDTSGETATSRQTVAYRGTEERRAAGDRSADEATANTHEEDIETVIDEVHGRLRTQYEQGRAEVLFREVRDAGTSPVRTYLAVLFLSHRGHVRLQQDELFGDLWIRDPAAPTAGDEAVAD